MHRLIATIMFALLCGCSWHLAQDRLSPKIDHVYLQSMHPYARFESELRHQLQYHDVLLADNSSEAVLNLRILTTHLDHSTPTIGTSNQARIYTFTFDMTFDVLDKDRKLIPTQTVVARRHLILPRGQLLNNNNQLRILERELHRDAIKQLFDRLTLVS